MLENIPSSKSTNLEIIEFAFSLSPYPHSLWCLILAIPAITSVVRVLLYSTLFHVSYWIQLTHTWLNLLIITSFILLYVQSFINVYIIKSNILAFKAILSLSEFVVQRKDLLFSSLKNFQKTKKFLQQVMRWFLKPKLAGKMEASIYARKIVHMDITRCSTPKSDYFLCSWVYYPTPKINFLQSIKCTVSLYAIF